jgi:hypothetical protein
MRDKSAPIFKREETSIRRNTSMVLPKQTQKEVNKDRVRVCLLESKLFKKEKYLKSY